MFWSCYSCLYGGHLRIFPQVTEQSLHASNMLVMLPSLLCNAMPRVQSTHITADHCKLLTPTLFTWDHYDKNAVWYSGELSGACYQLWCRHYCVRKACMATTRWEVGRQRDPITAQAELQWRHWPGGDETVSQHAMGHHHRPTLTQLTTSWSSLDCSLLVAE